MLSGGDWMQGPAWCPHSTFACPRGHTPHVPTACDPEAPADLWPHSEPTARACAGREPWRRCEAVRVGLHAPAPSQPGSELTPGGGNLRSVRSFVRFNISVYLNSWKCECLISISPSKINSGISPKKGEEKKLLRKLKNLNRLSL